MRAFAALHRVPLIGHKIQTPRGAVRRAYQLFNAVTLPHALLKPQRQLGASYIDSKVERRKNVRLCDACIMKYGVWWKRANYKPDWQYHWISDCAGCSMPFSRTTGFYPEEMFYRVLAANHGRLGKPTIN